MTTKTITLSDVEAAFHDLDAASQEYVLNHVQSVPEAYLYYTNHWVWKNDSDEQNRQRAIDTVYSAMVAIKNDTYGLRD
jgi:hypothetical protein